MYLLYNSYKIFKILLNILDPPEIVKKSIEVCEDLENELQVTKQNLCKFDQNPKTS